MPQPPFGRQGTHRNVNQLVFLELAGTLPLSSVEPAACGAKNRQVFDSAHIRGGMYSPAPPQGFAWEGL